MPFPFPCPHCARQVQVNEEHVGQRLICPACQKHFTISVTTTAPQPPPIVEHRFRPPRDEVREGRSRVANPAIGLMVTGFCTVIMGWLCLPAILFPEVGGFEPIRDPLEMFVSVLIMFATLALGVVML